MGYGESHFERHIKDEKVTRTKEIQKLGKEKEKKVVDSTSPEAASAAICRVEGDGLT